MNPARTRKAKTAGQELVQDIRNLRLLIDRLFAETQGVDEVDDLRKLLETISRSMVRLVQLTQMQTAGAEDPSGADEIRQVLDEIVAAKRRGDCSRLPGLCGRASSAKVEATTAEQNICQG